MTIVIIVLQRAVIRYQRNELALKIAPNFVAVPPAIIVHNIILIVYITDTPRVPNNHERTAWTFLIVRVEWTVADVDLNILYLGFKAWPGRSITGSIVVQVLGPNDGMLKSWLAKVECYILYVIVWGELALTDRIARLMACSCEASCFVCNADCVFFACCARVQIRNEILKFEFCIIRLRAGDFNTILKRLYQVWCLEKP